MLVLVELCLEKLIAQHSSNLSLIIGGVENINIDHNRLLALTTNILMDGLFGPRQKETLMVMQQYFSLG